MQKKLLKQVRAMVSIDDL